MRRGVIIFIALLFAPVVTGAQARMEYGVQYARADESRIRVSIELPEPLAGPQPLIMPRAIPMGYGEQPYDRFVENLRAYGAGDQVLAVERTDGPRWTLGKAGAKLRRVAYDVDLARMEREVLNGGDASKVRPKYAGLLGYSVFAYIEGQEDKPIRLRVDGPKDWPVFSTLAPAAPPANGSVTAEAADFYALADSQIVMGPAVVFAKLDGPVPLFVTTYSEGEADSQLLGNLGLEAFRKVIAYFGSAPFRHYSIVQEFLKPIASDHQYSLSMEHMQSGTFTLDVKLGITAASNESEKIRVLFNFAHHIAHSWIPKRAYGEGYFPFRWELAPVFDSIWFSEGFAQYAAMDALADALPETEAAKFRERMIEMRFRQNLAAMPAFLRQMPLIEVSRIASTRYGEDWRTGRTVFSRGGLMAAEMDARIRKRTQSRKGLRDALQHLMVWSAKEKRAFRIEELPTIFKEATGVETRDILEKWLAPIKD
jgi:predicted metalloprotease with PDZ domain